MKKFTSKIILIAAIFLAIFSWSCSENRPPSISEEPATKAASTDAQPSPADSNDKKGQLVKASFYGKGDGFQQKKTASGERFDPKGLTAAHKTLPFDTIVEVTNPENGKSVDVRVNDRGPVAPDRKLDLSVGAAQAIGLDKKGIGKVEMKVKDTP